MSTVLELIPFVAHFAGELNPVKLVYDRHVPAQLTAVACN